MRGERPVLNRVSSNSRTRWGGVASLVVLLSLHPASNGSPHEGAQRQEANNDRILAIQKYGGVRKDTGEVTFTFYGNMAFKIISPRGVEVFIDPWRNDVTGMYPYWYEMQMPMVKTDIGLVTHAHFDHDAIDRLEASMIFDRMAGTYELGDVKITGIAEKHVCETQGKYPYRALVKQLIDKDPCPPNETMQWNNSLYVIETGGLRILHWGDNRQNPPDYIWDQIGKIDVAILAVSDDGHILSQKWADIVMDRMDAKVVIPSHYYVKGINIPNHYGLESAETWTKKHEHTMLDNHTIALSPAKVASLHHHVMYFGDHVPFPVAGKAPTPQDILPDVPAPDYSWERFAPKDN
jgi:L-ascorbate metabolism protein UlaG (beta-lactamase superfamily)